MSSSATCSSEYCNQGWSEVLTHMSPYGWASFGVAFGLGLSIVGAAWGIWLTGSSRKFTNTSLCLKVMNFFVFALLFSRVGPLHSTGPIYLLVCLFVCFCTLTNEHVNKRSTTMRYALVKMKATTTRTRTPFLFPICISLLLIPICTWFARWYPPSMSFLTNHFCTSIVLENSSSRRCGRQGTTDSF